MKKTAILILLFSLHCGAQNVNARTGEELQKLLTLYAETTSKSIVDAIPKHKKSLSERDVAVITALSRMLSHILRNSGIAHGDRLTINGQLGGRSSSVQYKWAGKRKGLIGALIKAPNRTPSLFKHLPSSTKLVFWISIDGPSLWKAYDDAVRASGDERLIADHDRFVKKVRSQFKLKSPGEIVGDEFGLYLTENGAGMAIKLGSAGTHYMPKLDDATKEDTGLPKRWFRRLDNGHCGFTGEFIWFTIGPQAPWEIARTSNRPERSLLKIPWAKRLLDSHSNGIKAVAYVQPECAEYIQDIIGSIEQRQGWSTGLHVPDWMKKGTYVHVITQRDQELKLSINLLPDPKPSPSANKAADGDVWGNE